jgi:hypothetical protein
MPDQEGCTEYARASDSFTKRTAEPRTQEEAPFSDGGWLAACGRQHARARAAFQQSARTPLNLCGGKGPETLKQRAHQRCCTTNNLTAHGIRVERIYKRTQGKERPDCQHWFHNLRTSMSSAGEMIT